VREELEKAQGTKYDPGKVGVKLPETVTKSVISEIGGRKSRENNIVIFGTTEKDAPLTQERTDYDRAYVSKILKACDIEDGEYKDSRMARLGRFDKDKPIRPILVCLKSQGAKGKLFKNVNRVVQYVGEFKDIRISNDLTIQEREIEKKLYNEAKQLQEKESGDFIYKVRGPPWERKVRKIPKPM
jgi:hypothetical protein